MNKTTYTIKKSINPDIKVGDIVKVIDGSAFSLKNVSKQTEDLYIVYVYPELTGLDLPIKELNVVVIKTNVKNKAIVFKAGNVQIIYIQDIILQIGKSKFMCSSKHVIKL